MRKRLLACFLTLAMVLGMMPAAALSAHAEETTVTPPFTSITTEDGEAVSYSYKGAIPAATSWATYEDGPYYHVTIPEGTEKVLVTYPADMGIAGVPSAFTYTLSVPDYTLGYGNAYLSVATNEDGSKVVTIPVADYLLTDGTGTAVSLEEEGSFAPITFFSFEYGTASCLTVSADAPTGGTIKVGELYQVALDKVFADSQGHDLTYSFETTVTNQHTKIQENTFVFSAQEVGTYEVKLTATCGQATATHTLNITVEKASEGLEAQYNYDETDKSSVTVYVTLSNDGMPVQGDDGTVMAHLEVTVPYFDLSLYGLERYYRYGTENGQGAYTDTTVIKRPTGLHLYIYLLERYYLGLPEEECCLGTSGVLDISDHTDVFYMDGERAYTSSVKAIEVSGLATSLFLFNFWGHDCNLMYFRNHCYPYMSAGWGATADYILLSDGDSWDVGLFTNWQFNTTGGFFACFDQDDYTVNPGEELTVSTLYWGTTSSSGDFEEKTGLNVQLYNSDWEYVKSLSYNEGTNSLTFTVPEEAGEYYLLALDPNATDTVLAKGAPAVAKLTVGSGSGSVDISSYYDDYDFISVKDDQGRYLVDIKGYTVSTDYNGDVPAHQITVEEGTETVYVTYPSDKSFVEYTVKYSVEDAAQSGYGKNVTLTTNDDGTITVGIPTAKYLDTGSGILLENGSYTPCYGFDFVTGTITKVEVGSDVAVSRILLNTYEKTLVYNSDTENTFQIVATVLPAEATGWTIQWTSDNEAVAKVDENGLVTAVGKGDAVITATIGEISASCTIHAQRYNTAPAVNTQMASHTKVKTGETVTLDDVSASFTDEQGDALTFTAKLATPASVTTGYEYSYTDGAEVAIDENGTCSYTFENTGVYALKITANDGMEETSFYYQVTVVPNDAGLIRLNDGVTLDLYNVAVVGHSEELVEDYEIPYKGTHDTVVHHIVLSNTTIEGTPYRKMDIQVAEGYGWCQYTSMTPDQTSFWQTRGDIGLFVADQDGNLSAHYLQFHTECAEHTDADDDGICDVCTLVLRESVNALSAMSFHSTYSATDTDYVLVPAFDPAVKEYTLEVSDSKNACYAKATLAEGVEGTITAAWVNLNNNDSRTAILTSASKTLTGAVKTGNYNNTVVVTVTDGDDNVVDTYTVNIVRTPSLTALGLDGIKLNETFLTTTTAYTASTAADSVTVVATPRDESYTVTVNGEEDTTVALEMGENDITVVVKNEDGYEMAYTITVTRKAAITVSFEVNVENPNITMKDANKTVVVPVDGVYTLISGATYSYTVQKDGYIGQTNSFTLEESGVIEIELDKATENPDLDKTIYAQWANFRNGPNHLGITSAATPYDPEDAELLWAAKYGTGWAAAPGSPIMVDGDIITYVGSTIKRLDSMTGEVVAEGTMVASSSYSIVPATYADGMIFVGLSGGRIQAFNAKTLESLWVYTDELGGQPNCPITYKDGYIYAGFWNSETKDANFVCIYTIDEDHENTTESKLASWTYTRAGGFYWAGAYASDKFVVVGTDNGVSDYTTESASLLVFDRLTGELVASENGIRGDIRSNVSYDPTSDRVFFTSKGGILCNAKVNWTTGEISDFHQVVLQDANGTANAMSTCTPSVYNDRIYIGVCGASQFGDNSGHAIAVYDLNSDGSMTLAYTYAIKGYPQTSAMVTTAYADEDEGYVYIYLPYNSTPGGISVLKDKKGQTEPLTTTDSGYSEVFTPVAPLSQYCICSTIADEYGTIYYKNDSCYMMAITSKIESLELIGTPSDTGFKAVTHQKNGTTRDVTDYVEITQDADAGTWAVSYTYGFDSDNYGLKTLTVYSVTLPEGDGYTVTGDATAAGGEDYTFTVALSGCYEKGENFAVKVNGETVNANEDGTYTVEEVSESLVITVEGVEAKTIEITVYYADNGTIVTGDDAEKTLLNFAPVTVTDVNGDGKFTMYDGFYCFHEQYHANGAAGYTDSNWVSQFWSVSTGMVSYGKNNRWVFSTAAEITDGDSLCLYTYQDQLSWSDLYTYFDNLTATATANEETSFHVNGYSFFGSSSTADAIANPVGATVTATCGETTLTTTTDDEGNFSFTFPSAGEWTILVNGKCSYSCDAGYYVGVTYTDAPVTPAMMTVTVEEPPYVAPDPIEVYMYYATRSNGIVAGKDGTLLNYVPLTVTDADMDGILTMSDAFYALHEAYYEGGAAAGYQNAKYTMTFWGSNLLYGQFERNGSNDNVYADTAIENGDMLAILGGYGYNCLWTHFENGMAGLTATATAGEATKFHINAYQANGAVGNVTLPEGATVTATCGDTTITTTVDANGDFTLTFPTAGEYSVLVDGTSEVNGVKCSVIPALMTVTVEAPTYTVTLPEGEGYTVSPATGYTTSVKAGESFKFFVETKVGYQKGENFTVKADGQPLTADSNGYYTLENVTANVTITVEGVEAIVWEPVTVYFSISDDAEFQIGKDSKEVMALRKISVPYFDLGLYGLEDYYFSSETYGSDGGAHSSDLLPGTAEYAYGKVTLLHLYIYALEVYYCGLDENEAGQGYLYEQNLIGTEVLTISGGSGSLYMNQFWGGDENLNYYVNYQYPLASAGWGSTSDQILLREGDVITLGHFTSWSFFNDPDSIFNYLTPDEDNKVYGTTTVTQGDKLTLTGYHAGADMSGTYTTAHTKLTSEPTIYYALYDEVEQDFGQWTILGNLSADGTIVFDTADLAPGTYVVAMSGLYGSEITDEICSTPGGILVVVEEKDTTPGDVNGDGQITTVDVTMVQMYLKGKTTLTEEQLAAADVNGDGKVTSLDVTLMKMYIKNKLDNFPNAK